MHRLDTWVPQQRRTTELHRRLGAAQAHAAQERRPEPVIHRDETSSRFVLALVLAAFALGALMSETGIGVYLADGVR